MLLRLVIVGIALVWPLASVAQGTFAVNPTVGIWINPFEVAALPMSGDAWDDILDAANAPCGVPDLFDQGDDVDPCILAKAIVSVRLYAADASDPLANLLRLEVLQGIGRMMDEDNWCENDLCPPCAGVPGPDCARRTLALGRNLGPYLAAADLIGIGASDTPSRADLVAFLEGTGDPNDPEEIRVGILEYEWIDQGTFASPTVRRRLREAHAERPNNWGAQACASSAAAAILREDAVGLLETYAIATGWLGDCDEGDCSQFNFGAEAADWTCDQTPPEYGVNEASACWVNVSQSGGTDLMNMNGTQVDDMRRGGPFPAGCDGNPRSCVADVHIWEGLQGRATCAHILRRQGLDLYKLSEVALLRSYTFQHNPIWNIGGVPGQAHPPHLSQDGGRSDDAFLAYIFNYAYGIEAPLDPDAGGPGYKDSGKGFGWTRYTLGEHPCGALAGDPNFDGVCGPAAPALPVWGPAALGALLLLGARVLLPRRSR